MTCPGTSAAMYIDTARYMKSSMCSQANGACKDESVCGRTFLLEGLSNTAASAAAAGSEDAGLSTLALLGIIFAAVVVLICAGAVAVAIHFHQLKKKVAQVAADEQFQVEGIKMLDTSGEPSPKPPSVPGINLSKTEEDVDEKQGAWQ